MLLFLVKLECFPQNSKVCWPTIASLKLDDAKRTQELNETIREDEDLDLRRSPVNKTRFLEAKELDM